MQRYNEPSLHILRNGETNFQFLIIAKVQASLEMMKFVTRISEIGRDENISELLVVDFEKLYMSKSKNFILKQHKRYIWYQ